MTDQEIINLYLPIVPFIANLLGPSCEVLLHDLSKPEHSVVAIANGYHSNRKIGSPITDIAIQISNDPKYKDLDFLSNYTAKSKDKNFLSSTYFLKNEGRLIGMICINRDLSIIQKMKSDFDLLMHDFSLFHQDQEFHENLNSYNNVNDLLHDLVQTAIRNACVPPSRMSMQEKIDLVHQLNEQGILSMKGAVSEIARQLNISEPTVYRYIKK
ncbi:helix-turn-helix transcriptional regulator [Anaerosacchariphilus polymeriproducens]|nr:PAS domain-containing protein [Anaerosacchariphilus polymeriproducens]